jgi:predicted PurR-regulated permease PerM
MNAPLPDENEHQAPAANPARQRSFADFARKVALVAVVVTALLLITVATQVFLVLFMAILVAVLVRSLSGWVVAHTPLTERWAVGVVLLALMALLAGLVAVSAPSLSTQFDSVRQTIPASFERLQQQIERYEWGRASVAAAGHAGEYLPEPDALVRRVAGVFSTTFGAAGAFLVVLFLGIYMAIEPRTYRRGLLHLVPPSRRARAGAVLDELRAVLKWWLLSILMSMTVVGLLTGIGLWVLGIPMVFALALLAFLLAFIPNIGPILAAAPAVLIAFTISPTKALYVALLYIGVQTVESYFITPFIERKTVSLPPALTVTVQLLLGLLTGLAGVMVAAPLTAAGLVLVRRLYVEDTLGDRTGMKRPETGT